MPSPQAKRSPPGSAPDGDRPRRLPVDAFYPDLNLVIECHERQHSEAVAFFDHPDRRTVSGFPCGRQRALYDRRRREILPMHGIRIVEFSYSEFAFSKNKRLQRDELRDLAVVRQKLAVAVRSGQ
jgi:hypothetical protein